MAFWSRKKDTPKTVEETVNSSPVVVTSSPEAAPAAAAAPAATPAAASTAPTPVAGGPAHVTLGSAVTPSLGKMMAVLISSPRHQRMTLAEVYTRFLPPLTLNQFVVAEARPAGQEQTAPVGLVLWAEVSDAVQQRLMSDPTQPTLLAANEWRSGPNTWIVDALGPGPVVEAMMKQLLEGPFKGREVKLRRRQGEGQPFVVESLDPRALGAKV